MLKDLTKYLPFVQSAGKREKGREKPEPSPIPPEKASFTETAGADEAGSGPEASPEPDAPEKREEIPAQENTDAPGEADLKAGLAACRIKDYPAALEAFLRAAEQGSMEAQFLCGQMYQRGLAVDASDKQALNWYRRSAKQGLVHAQMACAAMFEEGRGTEMDLKRALSWYEQAAKQGSVEAQLKCGVMYSCGRAETRNPKKARRWLETAAGSGNEEAKRILQERF